jgi:hypothetical protein
MTKKPKTGDILWGVWEHRYYNEKRLVELEYVVYPVKITKFFKRKYVDAHCVGIDVDGYTAVHWIAIKNIGKTVFYNPTDAARYAAAMSDYYDKHYTFGGTSIRRTQWEHFLGKD